MLPLAMLPLRALPGSPEPVKEVEATSAFSVCNGVSESLRRSSTMPQGTLQHLAAFSLLEPGGLAEVGARAARDRRPCRALCGICAGRATRCSSKC